MQSITIHFDRVRSMALSAVKNTKIVRDYEEILQAISLKIQRIHAIPIQQIGLKYCAEAICLSFLGNDNFRKWHSSSVHRAGEIRDTK